MRSTARTLALFAAALLLTSCEDTQGPATTDPLEDEIADVAGSLAANDVLAMQGQGMPGFGTPGQLFPPMFAGMPPCGGATPCPEAERDGLTHSRTITFFDGDGAEQPAYDSLATASIRFQLAVTGTLVREYCSADIERDHDLVLSGLAGVETQATWNGSGSTSMLRTCTYQDGVRTADIETTSVVDDVVVPRGTTQHWPLSGSITQTHRVVRDVLGGTATVERTAVITFNGTRYAELVIGGRTFTIDLAQRGERMPRRQRQ
jgi:hypothetical protein